MFLFSMTLRKCNVGKTPLVFKLAWLRRKEPRGGGQMAKLRRETESQLNG